MLLFCFYIDTVLSQKCSHPLIFLNHGVRSAFPEVTDPSLMGPVALTGPIRQQAFHCGRSMILRLRLAGADLVPPGQGAVPDPGIGM